MFYKDLVFTSMVNPHKHILELKESFSKEQVNVFENRSDETLCSVMVHAQSKPIHPISYVKTIVIMRQLVKALKTLHKYKIYHGNIKPSNIVFIQERNWHSLKLIGLESAYLIEETVRFNEKFDEVLDIENLVTKMNIHNNVKMPLHGLE